MQKPCFFEIWLLTASLNVPDEAESALALVAAGGDLHHGLGAAADYALREEKVGLVVAAGYLLSLSLSALHRMESWAAHLHVDVCMCRTSSSGDVALSISSRDIDLTSLSCNRRWDMSLSCGDHSDDTIIFPPTEGELILRLFQLRPNPYLLWLAPADRRASNRRFGESFPAKPAPNFPKRPSTPKSKGRLALWPSPEGLARSLSRHALMEMEGDPAVRKLASRADAAFPLASLH